MAYVSGAFPIQLFPEEFAKLLKPHGWEQFLEYKIIGDKESGKTRKQARVYLFKSLGSDMQNRYFGYVHSYGNEIANPLGEEFVITRNSPLGIMVKDKSDNKKYWFKVNPVLKNRLLKVFVNGEEVDPSTYDATNIDKGYIVFGSAPSSEDVRATYTISDDAPPMPDHLYFFTFEEVVTEQFKYNVTLTKIADNTFIFPAGVTRIKEGSLVVRDNQGTEIDPSRFTIDWDNVTTLVISGDLLPVGTITADYIIPLITIDGKMEDISDSNLNPASGVSVIQCVYESMRFIAPSLPTTITFIDEFTEAWSRDSDVIYWGNITKDRIVMMFRVEPTPDPVKAYYVPLYIGRLTTLDKSPRMNTVIIGGGNLVDRVASNAIITVNNKQLNYGPNVTNGLDGIQVQQGIGGSLYQKHYLSFITHDPMADISPESRYNPSAYTDKYHISPIYVVHPNDGFVGLLDEVYAVHPKNIAQQDELIVKETATNEFLGKGDGSRTIFHLRHTPKNNTLVIKVNCIPMSEGTDYTIIETTGTGDADEQIKRILFNTPPAQDAEVYADYEYEQTYIFLLPTVPETPFLKDTVSPYAPIGLGILKLNGIDA